MTGHEVSSISPESAMKRYNQLAETQMGIRSNPPPPVMSTYQRKVTVLGLDTEDEPLQLPLFLDKGGKSKMKMQVANEHSSTYCLLTTFSLTYEPTLLKRTQSY